MTLSEYQKLAMRTSPVDGHDRIKNGCMGLIGEGGELMDVLKKWMFQSVENAPLPRERLLDELGDIMWYLAELASGLKTTLGAISRVSAYRPDGDEREFPHELAVHHLCFSAYMLFSGLDVGCHYRKPGAVGAYPDDVEETEWILKSAKENMRAIMHIVVLLAKRSGSCLQGVMQRNIDKLAARYPEGFDPARSLGRETADAPPWEV